MKKILFLMMVLSVVMTADNAMASIFVDGNLTDDWGVTPGEWGSTNWVPTNGALYSNLTNEDGKGGLNSFVGPGVGGQLFDAEAMYYKRESGMIYLAIVTGHPQGGASSGGVMYYPGDIGFDFNNDGIYEYGLVTRNGNQGKLYSNLVKDSWKKGLKNWGGATDPTTIIVSNGMAGSLAYFTYNNEYYYTADDGNINNDHWVIEVGIPTSYFGDAWANGGNIHWTQTCGNDALDLNIPVTTPEPASVALLGLGLAGLAGLKRKKRII